MVDSRGWEGYWLEGTKFLGYKICPRDILYSLVPIGEVFLLKRRKRKRYMLYHDQVYQVCIQVSVFYEWNKSITKQYFVQYF